MNNTAYIYKVTNKITEMVYIGVTRDRNVFSRWNEHFNSNSKIGVSIDIHGIESFIFEVLEKFNNISNSDLFRKETEYIQIYDSIERGYNSIYSHPTIKKPGEFSQAAKDGISSFESSVYLGNPSSNSNNKMSFWPLMKDRHMCILTLLSSKNYLTNSNSKYSKSLKDAFNKREQRRFALTSYGHDYYIDNLNEVINLMEYIYKEDFDLEYKIKSYSVRDSGIEFEIYNDELKSTRFEIKAHMLYEDEAIYYERIIKINDLLEVK